MKSGFLSRFGIRIIVFAIVMVIGFFVAGYEMLKVSGSYEDFWDLKSTELKDGGHYGGGIYYVYYNYAEEGYEDRYSGEMRSAYEQYYLVEIYIEALDESRFLSISLRDAEDIAQANKNANATYEQVDADPESYILFVDGLCEPLDPELAGYMKEFLVADGWMGADENLYDYVLPYNIRQVNTSGNMTIIIIGLAVIVIAGVVITVFVSKAKKEKEQATVNLELPPEVAEAVKNYGKKQPANEDFFADLDRKKHGGDPGAQSGTGGAAGGANAAGAENTAGSGMSAPAEEMDSLTPPEIEDELPSLEIPAAQPNAADETFGEAEKIAGETKVGDMSADEFMNKDFLKM
jgi:hypothetical protein